MINNTSYNLITSQKDKLILLEQLVKLGGEVLLKLEGVNAPIIKASPVSLIENLKILFKVKDNSLKYNLSEVGVIQANIEDQKIMSQIDLSNRGSGHILGHFKYDLYKVQRREFFRLKLPSDFKAFIELPESLDKIRLKIDDISAGGLQVLDTRAVTPFKVMDKFFIQLIIPGFEPESIKVVVRRVQKAEVYKVGLSFLEVTKERQGELLSLVMQLYRRFYQPS